IAGIGVVGRGFAQIVEAGPDEFAGDVWKLILAAEFPIRWRGPRRGVEVVGAHLKICLAAIFVGDDWEEIFTARADAGGGFTSKERKRGIGLASAAIIARLVIVAEDIDLLLETVESRVVIIACGSHGSRGIFGMNDSSEFGGDFVAGGRALLRNFVADAPENHAGMVPVTPNQRAHIFFVPVGEQEMVIISGFAPNPAIKGFVHNHETETVGKVEQFRSGRIVAGADGVVAHFFENLKLSLQRASVDGRAQRAEIVVIAHAVERHALAIEQKAFVRSEFY